MTMSSDADRSVSVVVPVRNGARWLRDVLLALVAECDGTTAEILVVDDGSEDESVEVARLVGDPRVRVIPGPRRGAAAAVNAGVRAARYEYVAQVDQDVVVRPGWLASLLGAMARPDVAAAQGCYVRDPAAPLLSRVMALDLEQRYARLPGGVTDHVCTGNVVWRAEALRRVGLLDESLGYGYDNDLSYRLTAAGYRLVICPGAVSHHRWRDGWTGYLSQQYGFGYGRLDLVWRYPQRLGGDRVSPLSMMAHPIVMAAALAALGVAAVLGLAGRTGEAWLAAACGLLALLAVERGIAGARAWVKWRDPAAALFPIAHLARDLAWVAAMGWWVARRATGRPSEPRHSMRPRGVARGRLSAPTAEP